MTTYWEEAVLWLSACTILILDVLLGVCVPFPFDVLDKI